MIGWWDIQSAIVTALRGSPDVLVQVGGTSSRIYAYEDKYPGGVNYFQGIDQMKPPSIMVAWVGTSPVDFGDARQWQHRFSLIQMPNGRISDMTKAIVNGEVTAYGAPFIECDFGLSIDPAGDIIHQRSTVDYGDAALQYYETLLSYTEWTNR